MPLAVLYAHLSTSPTQVTLARPDLPFDINEVLNTALAKVPGNRYPSCADFADALREALGLDPYDPSKSARPPTTAVPARPPIAPTMPLTPPGAPREGGPGAWPGQRQEPPRRAGPASGGSPGGQPRPGAPARRRGHLDRGGVHRPRLLRQRVRGQRAGHRVDQLPRRAARAPHPADRRRGPHRPSQRLRGIEPEIDLIGPPRDPGVSRLHAKLIPAPGGSWTVVDLGTENGITVNGQDVPSGDSVPRPGDRIHLGAWTKITITRG